MNNGQTWTTAVDAMLFSLMHRPCITTFSTIHKKPGSLKWTVMSFPTPTVCGIVLYFVSVAVARMFI